jgi:DNA (cytosine-5)-methyltransferase 1
MNNGKYQYLSLFSGCGGFDLGFLSKGYIPIGAFDCDPEAVRNYSHNINAPAHIVDLRQGIPHLDMFKDIDVLIAGPPCQGFSIAGKRQVHDERNNLLTLTGHFACQARPKVLVVENVPGALIGKHRQYWNQLDESMRFAGYRTHTINYKCTDIGMSQRRSRIFLFAWRTSRDINFEIKKEKPGTLRECLGGVDGKLNHQPQMLKSNSTDWRIARKIKPGQKLCNVRGGLNSVATWDIPEVFGQVSDEERTVLELLRRLRRRERQRSTGDADPVSFQRLENALGSRFHRLIEALLKKKYLRKVDGGIDLVGTFNGKYRRLSWNEPSYTVDTRFGSPRFFLHPAKNRGFTVREAARLQGFSDSYIFNGNITAQFRLIGNAVPPPLGATAADFVTILLG